MLIRRDAYLHKLVSRIGNGQIKVITGIRRCGKSFLLFRLFCDYLIDSVVPRENIISLTLDDDQNARYRDPNELSRYVRSRLESCSRPAFVLLDEVQYAISKEELHNHDEPVRLYGVLNGLMRLEGVDVYVTGSNSEMLSRDVMTEFRGRGDVVEVRPLSFAEYYGHAGGNRADAYEEYAYYGGLPFVLSKETDEEKAAYLSGLFEEVYFRDILERYDIRFPDVMAELTDCLCSSVGSLTNASKLANTLKSVRGINVSSTTISSYLGCLTESFLFGNAKRYDVKGKRYFEYPSKYYCSDLGLRNARLNFRQQEETHIMENVIYNELVGRGFGVDVGVVEIVNRGADGKAHQTTVEIDFVANKGSRRYYIQSALALPDEAKACQELRPLMVTGDSFKKVVVSKTNARPWIDEVGVLHLGLYDFLLDEAALG